MSYYNNLLQRMCEESPFVQAPEPYVRVRMLQDANVITGDWSRHQLKAGEEYDLHVTQLHMLDSLNRKWERVLKTERNQE